MNGYNSFFVFCTVIVYSICCLGCQDFPISVSNVSYCVDNNCFYTQLASSLYNIQNGFTSCYTFNSLSNTTQSFKVSVGVSDITATSPFGDCYFTDDAAVVANFYCACDLGLGTDGTCPSSAPNTAFVDNQFCITVPNNGPGCIGVGRTSANVGVSVIKRYMVCRFLDTPTYNVGMTVTDTGDNDTHTLFNYGTSNIQFDHPGNNFNLSMSILSSTTGDLTGKFYVYDSNTGSEYVLNSDYVNGISEYNPKKIGFFKLLPNGFVDLPLAVRNQFSIITKSCPFNQAGLIYNVANIKDVIRSSNPVSARTEDTTLDMPILSTGFIFYNADNTVSWIGYDLNRIPTMGPNVYSPIGNNTYLNQLNIQGSYFPNTTALYFNQSTCQIFFLQSSCFGWAWCWTGWGFGLVKCPNEQYFAYFNPSTQYGIVTNHTIYPAASVTVGVRFYPNPELYPGPTVLHLDDLYSKRVNHYGNITRDYPTAYTQTVDSLQAILTLTYSNYYVSFDTLSIRPFIQNVQQLDGTILLTARSLNNPGTCFFGSSPILFPASSVFLATNNLDFPFTYFNLNYTGCVIYTLTCGANKVTYSSNISIAQGFLYTPTPPVSVSANPFTSFSGLSIGWYFYRIAIYILIAVFAGLFLYFGMPLIIKSLFSMLMMPFSRSSKLIKTEYGLITQKQYNELRKRN